MQKLVLNNFKSFSGQCVIPADKSISHRAVMFSSLARGKSVIRNFSQGKDPVSTLSIMKNLGVDISQDNSNLLINSSGKLKGFQGELDCGNSGTTMRLLSGVLAGQNFDSVLIGDDSLSKRPMKRVIEPLQLMGAVIDSENYRAPLKIYGHQLQGVTYSSKIASAQVKSCILLAGLYAQGNTIVTEPYLSRNHTEIMLKYMGADIEVIADNNGVKISKSELSPIEINVPGDISSAAYFMAAGLIVPNSKIILKNVGLNPTRTGILDVIKNMGGNIEILDLRDECGEPVGDIKIEYTPDLKPCNISGDIIPRLIDEIPVIAVIASQAKGETVISDAQDLRNKESDRIKLTVSELKSIGVDIEENPDGMVIRGKRIISGGNVNSHNDHRLAMSLYVAGLISKNQVVIDNFEWVNISFPEFESIFESLKTS